jgi:hypothetical protein
MFAVHLGENINMDSKDVISSKYYVSELNAIFWSTLCALILANSSLWTGVAEFRSASLKHIIQSVPKESLQICCKVYEDCVDV